MIFYNSFDLEQVKVISSSQCIKERLEVFIRFVIYSWEIDKLAFNSLFKSLFVNVIGNEVFFKVPQFERLNFIIVFLELNLLDVINLFIELHSAGQILWD